MTSRRKTDHAGEVPPGSAASESYAAGARPLAPRPRRMPPPSTTAVRPVPTTGRLGHGQQPLPVFVWKEEEDRLRGARPGHEGAVSELARGDLPMYGTLDLHGLTVAEAERELVRFFAKMRGPNRRAVTIVHGKGTHSPGGKSVLREAMVLWLTSVAFAEAVLGFATARARDGGAGALYVLLAPRRPTD